VEDYLVLGDAQRKALAETVDGTLERLVGERLEAPALVAYEVVMMPEPVTGWLVAHDALTDFDALHERDLLELLHHAVDARARDAAVAGAE
jgi:hypothetical protein